VPGALAIHVPATTSSAEWLGQLSGAAHQAAAATTAAATAATVVKEATPNGQSQHE